jgi:hypothetical protein
VRAIRALGARGGGDRAAKVLALAVRVLPADRAPWGQAMLVELDCAVGRPARWQFSLGCVRAAAAIRIRATVGARDHGGPGMRCVLLATVGAALGLAICGLIRYPDLAAINAVWPSAGVLVGALVAYAVCALALLPGTTPHAATARRRGVISGIAIGVAWLAVLSPGGLRAWVLVPLLVALAVPAGVAGLTARTSRDRATATAAALWSGLVGGLLAFVTWVTATYVRDGRPYDRQLIRDFHHSGSHDLAAYAVSDNLGTALSLLVVIPVVCLALGSVAGRSGGHQDP